MARVDMQRLGVEDGDAVTLQTTQGSLSIPARAKDGVAEGTVVVPHGEREVNVNAILPAGAAHVEPLSGMCVMTGVPVDVQPRARREASTAAP